MNLEQRGGDEGPDKPKGDGAGWEGRAAPWRWRLGTTGGTEEQLCSPAKGLCSSKVGQTGSDLRGYAKRNKPSVVVVVPPQLPLEMVMPMP